MKEGKKVRINPLSLEAREVVKTYGNLMLLVNTRDQGPFNDWDDQVLLKPVINSPFQYWFRNGIDIEFELT
jgi:hypothetical protein|tara:strand:+ start:330 stop:542 length:213 start_codon:yes stop_codon:yes gene_type:complete